MKIALLQIAAADNLEKTLEKGVSFCRKAKELGADVALFPEMFSNGYDIYNRSVTEWVKEAISDNHEFVKTFENLAKELNMAIGITFLEKYEDCSCAQCL